MSVVSTKQISCPGISSPSRRATGSSEYFGSGFPFGPAEVREQHDARAAVEQRVDRRQRGANARVVGDCALVERHVEVDANERPLSANRLRPTDR